MKRLLLSLLVLLSFSARPASFDPQNTYVFIAGVLQWKDNQSLPPFSNVHRKDEELKNKFIQMGVPATNIVAMFDEKATLKSMQNEIKALSAKCDHNSTFIFYYAGHGVKDTRNKLYFANFDIDVNKCSTTGFSMEWLGHQLNATNNSQQFILMADCCYSGGLLEQGRAISGNERHTLVFSSATASNTSTGNWTFTQTVLDCLSGHVDFDTDGDGKITNRDMATEIKKAMKYREHQLSGYYSTLDNFVFVEQVTKAPNPLKNLDRSVIVESRTNRQNPDGGKENTTNNETRNNTTPEKTNTSTNTETYTAGEYAYGMYEKNWKPVRILRATRDNKYLARFYFYSDYKDLLLSPAEIKKNYFPQHNVSDTVMVTWKGKEYAARILSTEDDFYLISYIEYDSSWDEWVMYDRMSTGREQKVWVEESGKWYPGKILQQKEGKYFIRYDDYDCNWDEWVGKNRIKFK